MDGESLSRHSFIFALILVYVTFLPVSIAGSRAKVQVQSSDLFEGQPFSISCTLQLTKYYDDVFKDMPFSMKHDSRGSCEIEKFMEKGKCQPDSKERDGIYACGCSHDWNGLGLQFRFYYYISEVNFTIDHNVHFRCSIARADQESSQMDSATLSVFQVENKLDFEDPKFYCPDHDIEITLKLSERKVQAQDRYPFDRVEIWQETTRMVTFSFGPGGLKSDFKDKNDRMKKRISFLKDSDQVMQITIQRLEEHDSGQYKIFVYYKANPVVINPPKIPLNYDTINNPLPVSGGNATTKAPKTGVEVETTVKPPGPIYEFVRDLHFLINYEMTITSAPMFSNPRGQLLDFSYKRLDGGKSSGLYVGPGVVFTCKLAQKVIRVGTPPVQLEILHGYETLKRTLASSNLTYRLLNPDPSKKTQCKLYGPALNCLDSSDPRLRGVTLRLEKQKSGGASVPFNIILYTLSILINILLLWWTIWLVVNHVSLIVKRRKKLAFYRAKILLRHRAHELND